MDVLGALEDEGANADDELSGELCLAGPDGDGCRVAAGMGIASRVGGDPELAHLAQANLTPRLRMVALYYIANQRRYMVAGSGNRSEIAIGYFTKHGDGGVDIMPLGNLVKSQVRELARHLGVPEAIIDKPPSAGLWEGQTDEAEMGVSYEALDNFILTGEASEEARRKIEKKMAGSAHKRSLPPIPDF